MDIWNFSIEEITNELFRHSTSIGTIAKNCVTTLIFGWVPWYIMPESKLKKNQVGFMYYRHQKMTNNWSGK